MGICSKPARAVATFALLVLIAHTGTALEPSVREQLDADPRIAPALIEAIADTGSSYATIRFQLPEGASPTNERDAGDVHPRIFRLVELALPGELKLDRAGSAFELTAPIGAASALAMLNEPGVDSINWSMPYSDPRNVENKSVCSPTGPYNTCLHGRYKIQVNHGGLNARIASNNGTSTTWWTFSPSNWEILIKMLNACGINNRYWFFSSAATTASYSPTVIDTRSIRQRIYTNASNPMFDTSYWSCDTQF